LNAAAMGCDALLDGREDPMETASGKSAGTRRSDWFLIDAALQLVAGNL